MNHSQLAWEFAELFSDLENVEINEMLAKNVPIETLEFFRAYAEDFGGAACVTQTARSRLPNLMIVGYLLRVLEERLLETDGPPGSESPVLRRQNGAPPRAPGRSPAARLRQRGSDRERLSRRGPRGSAVAVSRLPGTGCAALRCGDVEERGRPGAVPSRSPTTPQGTRSSKPSSKS